MFAKGAFGSVFMIASSDTRDGASNGGGQAIALKVFSIAKRQDAEQGKNEYVCLRETRAGRVQHSVHAFGCCLFERLPPQLAIHMDTPGPFMAIAMPFVDGTTLDVYLTSYVACNARPLPQDECFSIVSAVVAFVTSGYRACGLVHGDLKPGNIMRNPTNKQIYVIDLTLGSCQARPPVGWHQGTTSFMPPERLLFFDAPEWASGPWAGAQGDMWAVGVIMATVYLTGEQMLAVPEYMAVLGPGRRYDPAISPTVFHLLWYGATWYADFVERVRRTTDMDSEIVAHFYRLVMWRRAVGLAPFETHPGIVASPNFQVLNRFSREAIELYIANAGNVYEIANETLKRRMGPDAYKLYMDTQSLQLDTRCPSLVQIVERDNARPIVSDICTHLFANLVEGVFTGGWVCVSIYFFSERVGQCRVVFVVPLAWTLQCQCVVSCALMFYQKNKNFR